MKLTLHRLHLPLAHKFTISRGSISTQPSLVAELEHDGLHGYGEVTENSFYGHTFDSISAAIRRAESMLNRYAVESPADVWPDLMNAVGNNTFAASALDMAAHDLHGRRLGIPAWQDWGLKWNDVPDSSYTIGIDTIDQMVAKLNEMPGWSLYKIKLGTDRDPEIVRELRKYTSAVFRVDANCGWTADQTISYSRILAELNVEFIEQPLPNSADPNDKLRVFQNSALPIIADEDCQRLDDADRCHGSFHGVNVKICKCGGLSPALTMLQRARELGMKTMIGCMVESSVGISAAAHLLPLLDYADLDGAVLLSDDPADGVRIQQGRITMPRRPGCGAELLKERLKIFTA